MTTSADTAGVVRPHTSRQLQALGRHYGIDYRFPELHQRAATVLRGRVQELCPAPGMQLVTSDIEVLERYDSRSRAPTPLSIIVMLAGEASLQLGAQRLTLGPGMALSVRLGERDALLASQPAGQRIRALTLSVDAPRLAALNGGATLAPASRMQAWPLPATLRGALEEALASPLDGPARQLQREGLALQLLAHGLTTADSPATAPPSAERQRLERVREALRRTPAGEHRLDDLAQLAAMSPAGLRRKYRAAFGRSVFDDLRHFRLALARNYLAAGLGVQQTAHFCGYRHAGNFSTAFRRHFGVSPGAIARQR
ncbi:helix-turn-helix transcriptional regulator [Kushneria aurantia]|uniref:Helix-turn-helix transcriptional regulator n=1 Tax=Kushneria aurantia TaxID=504092 RepID=A0ABV6G1G9_9GAMM|nr:AraC family transcriptional regulator [Kushneria aurantia]